MWDAFPPDQVQIGQAMIGVGIMVGPTLGPTLGGFIVDNWEWPMLFWHQGKGRSTVQAH